MEKNYTPKEVAERLRVTSRQVCKLAERGEIAAFKVGKHWRITGEALEALEGSGKPTPKRPAKQAS